VLLYSVVLWNKNYFYSVVLWNKNLYHITVINIYITQKVNRHHVICDTFLITFFQKYSYLRNCTILDNHKTIYKNLKTFKQNSNFLFDFLEFSTIFKILKNCSNKFWHQNIYFRPFAILYKIKNFLKHKIFIFSNLSYFQHNVIRKQETFTRLIQREKFLWRFNTFSK